MTALQGELIDLIRRDRRRRSRGKVVLGTECQYSPVPDGVEMVDHGPVKPPYGTPERAAYDREHADVPPNAGSAT